MVRFTKQGLAIFRVAGVLVCTHMCMQVMYMVGAMQECKSKKNNTALRSQTLLFSALFFSQHIDHGGLHLL